MNIGCGARTSLLELIDLIAGLVGTEVAPTFRAPRPGDVRHSEAAVDKAGRLLGYRPVVGLREGLARTVEWFASRRAPTPAP
jgi:nucleoside-diphosphate-sugar epimerase